MNPNLTEICPYGAACNTRNFPNPTVFLIHLRYEHRTVDSTLVCPFQAQCSRPLFDTWTGFLIHLREIHAFETLYLDAEPSVYRDPSHRSDIDCGQCIRGGFVSERHLMAHHAMIHIENSDLTCRYPGAVCEGNRFADNRILRRHMRDYHSVRCPRSSCVVRFFENSEDLLNHFHLDHPYGIDPHASSLEVLHLCGDLPKEDLRII